MADATIHSLFIRQNTPSQLCSIVTPHLHFTHHSALLPRTGILAL